MQNKFRLLFFTIAFLMLFIGQIHAQLDQTFGTNGVAMADSGHSDAPLGSFVLPDGKILVVSVNECCSTPNRVSFIRFNANGTLDSSYGTNGVFLVPMPYTFPNGGKINGAARQPDGKIVLVGWDDYTKGIIARFNENGTLDTSFANGGVHRPDIGASNERDGLDAVLIQPDGKILVAGYAIGDGSSTYGKLSLLRYHPNGSFDTSFGTNNQGYIIHLPIALPFYRGSEFFSLQSTGKIIVGNRYETYAAGAYPDRSSIHRFNADGTLDNSFTVLTYPDHNTIGRLLAVAVQPDDKILVGNQVTRNYPLETVSTDARVSRYNADGTVDTGFGTGGQVSFYVGNYVGGYPRGIQVQPDGQILVASDTDIFPNRGSYRGWWLTLFRLSSNGTVTGKFLVAKSFTNNYHNNNNKSFISILPDGKILTAYTGYTSADMIMLVRTLGVPLENYLFRSIPFTFSQGPVNPIYFFATPSYYRPSNRTFYFYGFGSLSSFFGLANDILAPSDYISDFNADVAVFRPSSGTWYIGKNYQNAATNFLAIRWGAAGDVPVPEDYNGDAKSDIAVFRPSDGNWYIYHIVDGSYTIQHWGLNGDKPTPGDFDGDGRADIAVFRPSEGNWYIQRSSDGGYTILHWGLNGDVPVQEDYDGDGKFDIAVYRPSTGIWYILKSSDGDFLAIQWGLSGDIPVPADYDGDLKTNIAVWRPSNGIWFVLNPNYVSMIPYTFGTPTDLPLPARY